VKLFLIGLPGSGKSYLGEKLALKLSFKFIDLDGLIESNHNKRIAEIFHEEGEDYFRKIESKTLLNQIKQGNNFVLSCGGGTPCYNSNMQLLKKSGITVYLKSNIKSIIARLNQSNETAKRPLLNQGDKLEKRVTQLLYDRSSYYEQADYILEIDKLDDPVHALASLVTRTR